MFKLITLILLVFLMLLGVSDVIYFLCSIILKPRKKAKKVLFVNLDKTFAESQVLSELFLFRWFGEKFAGKIVFLTDKLEKNEIKKLNRYECNLVEFKNGVFDARE